MNQVVIGQFIMKKRKEKNLTQEQLAEKLNVSNKTISKWETGKCMPDYGVIEALCKELDMTVSELMDGEKKEKNSIRVYDEQQILDLLKRVQNLEQQKNLLLGIMLVCIGIVFYAASHFYTGSMAHDLISGLLLGLSIGEALAGIYIIARMIGKR
ncbi:helix-turn-helix domain-containing protein [Anaeromassilibacillus senegalensis]|uniref:helix-turn-helix domain-containing protein n=1 Tax=Anaeromassilibacillus senegalensis TaxID=1673717 RepID=UPI000681E862|nr:helix-turn-helix transcriptional regulator [Anaeromassilibacillus senegalensis]